MKTTISPVLLASLLLVAPIFTQAQTIEWGDPTSGDGQATGQFVFPVSAAAPVTFTLTGYESASTTTFFTPDTTSLGPLQFPDGGIYQYVGVLSDGGEYALTGLNAASTYYLLFINWGLEDGLAPLQFSTDGSLSLVYDAMDPTDYWDAGNQVLGMGTDLEPTIAAFELTGAQLFSFQHAPYGGSDGAYFALGTAAIPEPSGALLLGITGVLGILRRRRNFALPQTP